MSWRTAKNLVRQIQAKRNRKKSQKKIKRQKIIAKLARRITVKGRASTPEFPSASSIRDELRRSNSIQVSSRTVSRDLRESGFTSYVRPVTTSSEESVFAARVELADKFANCSDKVLKQFVFVDESRVSLNDHSSRKQWVRNKRDLCRRVRKRRTDDNSISIFAAIGYNFRHLVLLRNKPRPQYGRGRPRKGENRPPKEPPLRLNAEKYIELCLKPLVPKLKNRILVQDGARPHISSKTAAFLNKNKVRRIEKWPAHSPQLNCVENAWPPLNVRISRQLPQNLDELAAATERAWREIPTKTLNSICVSFRDRLKRAKATRGRL